MGTKRKSNQTAAVSAAPEVIDDAVAAALAMIDAELGTDTVADEAAPEVELVAADIEADIEIDQPDDTDVEAVLAELEADAPSAPAKTKAAKTPKQPKTPAAAAREFTSVATITQSDLDTNMAGIVAKKVIEKAQNVIQAVETGRKLSRYTADAVRALKADGRVSGKSLVDTFRGCGLSDGTARAQSQQMTALFKALGIAVADTANARELIISDTALVDELVLLAA